MELTEEQKIIFADLRARLKQLEVIEELGQEEADEQLGANGRRIFNSYLLESFDRFGEQFKKDFIDNAIPALKTGTKLLKGLGELLVKPVPFDNTADLEAQRRQNAADLSAPGVALATGASRAVDIMQGFVFGSDPLQQIPAEEDEQVANNAPVLDGDMHDIEFNGGIPYRISTGEDAITGKDPLEIGTAPAPAPAVAPAPTPGAANSSAPAPGPKPSPELSFAEQFQAAVDEDVTLGSLGADLAATRARGNQVTEQRLTGLLQEDAYRRSVAASQLIDAAAVPTVQDNIANLARIPTAVSSDLRGNVALLQQGSPDVTVPSIQPGINAQATQTTRVMGQTDSALAGAERGLQQTVATQMQLREQLKNVIYQRLSRERGQ